METPSAETTGTSLTSAELIEHYDRFRTAMTGTGAVDKPVAEAALERLYEQAGLEPPAIIWCQSFYQMLTMPSLLIGLLHSDMWELIAGDATSRAKPKTWNKYWNKIWPDVWLNGGMPLLAGMNRTTRIGIEYGHLEGALISQAKSEFGKALHSGRLDNMQHKLKREMYRRFWAPHAREYARNTWARLKTDVFAEMKYVREHNPDWPFWDEIAECDEQLKELGEGVAGLFDLLADRLGGETRGQAGFMLDVPAGVPWLATAILLLQSWPNHFRRSESDIKMWLDICENASSIMCLDGVAFVCEKPFSFHITERNRLHYDNGPALAYSDGFEEYAWEGALVPQFIIMNPERISVQHIEGNLNIEVRRVMLEKYGVGRYIVDSGVEPVHEDQYGVLFRRELPGDEALVLLKVINSSPEPDGTFKEYFLRVPPNIQTAREAAAWTFGMDADFYGPEVET